MRMSRHLGVYAAQRVDVQFDAGASETLTITRNGVQMGSVQTNAAGLSGVIKLSPGAYTVTGSVSGYAAGVSVTLAGTYDAKRPNALYWYGNKCASRSGGWTGRKGTSGPDNAIQDRTNYYELSSIIEAGLVIDTNTIFDLSDYSKLCATINCTNANRSMVGYYGTHKSGTTINRMTEYADSGGVAPAATGTTTVEFSLSGAGNGYPAVYGGNSSGVQHITTVYAVWLE
jgi:hypothetical protein